MAFTADDLVTAVNGANAKLAGIPDSAGGPEPAITADEFAGFLAASILQVRGIQRQAAAAKLRQSGAKAQQDAVAQAVAAEQEAAAIQAKIAVL